MPKIIKFCGCIHMLQAKNVKWCHLIWPTLYVYDEVNKQHRSMLRGHWVLHCDRFRCLDNVASEGLCNFWNTITALAPITQRLNYKLAVLSLQQFYQLLNLNINLHLNLKFLRLFSTTLSYRSVSLDISILQDHMSVAGIAWAETTEANSR